MGGAHEGGRCGAGRLYGPGGAHGKAGGRARRRRMPEGAPRPARAQSARRPAIPPGGACGRPTPRVASCPAGTVGRGDSPSGGRAGMPGRPGFRPPGRQPGRDEPGHGRPRPCGGLGGRSSRGAGGGAKAMTAADRALLSKVGPPRRARGRGWGLSLRHLIFVDPCRWCWRAAGRGRDPGPSAASCSARSTITCWPRLRQFRRADSCWRWVGFHRRRQVDPHEQPGRARQVSQTGIRRADHQTAPSSPATPTPTCTGSPENVFLPHPAQGPAAGPGHARPRRPARAGPPARAMPRGVALAGHSRQSTRWSRRTATFAHSVPGRLRTCWLFMDPRRRRYRRRRGLGNCWQDAAGNPERKPWLRGAARRVPAVGGGCSFGEAL